MTALAERTVHESTLRIEQDGAYLGALVSGIDLSRPVTEADLAILRQAHAEYGLLIFRDQAMSPDDLIVFGKRFGALSVHPFAPNSGAKPELITFRNDENHPPFGTDCWHSDETFRLAPPMGTMLRATDVPSFGGDTMFASMAAAWEGLSDRMQHFISGLEACMISKCSSRCLAKQPKGVGRCVIMKSNIRQRYILS